MKALRIFTLMMIFMLGIGSQASAQTNNAAKKQLIEAIKESNKSCPMDLGGGIVMTSIKYTDPNCVFNFLTEMDDESMEMINLLSDTMTDIILESIKEDKSTKVLLELCKKSQTNILIVFRNKAGSNANIIIPYSKM